MAEKHIGIRESQYMVLNTAPDVCVVGIVPVPFDSFQNLSFEKSYISNVRARGKSILTVGSVIAGTQSNAGKGVISGTSQDKGDCEILTGVPHIKCKGKPIARNGSLVMMNNGNTIGTLYTQVNPPNGPIPVADSTSFWDKLQAQEAERQKWEMEAIQQMPDLYTGIGRGFVNNQYELGRQLGTSGMRNGSMDFEGQIAILKAIGADTSLMEKANTLNNSTIEEIDASPPLLDMKSESQEMGAKLENGLEWALAIRALVKGGFNALTWLRGGKGVGGVKVVVKSTGLKAFNRDEVLSNIEASKRGRLSSNFIDYNEWPPNRGVKGVPFKYILLQGVKIDRYGHEHGVFVSPKGIPYRARSLKPGTDGKPYLVYEVQQPITVEAGEIAPWFGYEGGGMQYELPDKVIVLLENGTLKRL